METVHCRSGRVRRGRESILSFLFSGLRQVVGPEWLPGQQSLVELCGPEGLIISSSRLPGRLLDLLPGEPTWEIGREEVAGERMSNYTRQGPAPRHAITFQMGYLPLVQREPAESGTHVVWDRAGQGSARQGREHQADSESGAEAWRSRTLGENGRGQPRSPPRSPLRSPRPLLQEASSSLSCPRPPRSLPPGPQLSVRRPSLPGPPRWLPAGILGNFTFGASRFSQAFLRASSFPRPSLGSTTS